MTCADLDLLWKLCRNPSDNPQSRVSTVSPSHKRKRFPIPGRLPSSELSHKRTREPLWIGGCCTHLPSLKQEFRTSADNYGDFCLQNAQTEDTVLPSHQELQDRAALFNLIKSCGNKRDLHKGSRIHVDILQRGLLNKDIFLGNALLSMYAKCGALAKAQELFNELPSRDVVTWNTLITGYAHHGLGEEALTCFEWMQDEGLSPNAVTFICILKACGSIGAAEEGEKIHAEVDKQGLLEKDIVLGTALVDMYAKCGALSKAQGVFNKLPTRNIITWNALIAGYAQYGQGNEALRCFGWMRDEGLIPNAVTFICILKACGSIGAADKGEDIHAEIHRQGLLNKNSALSTALVDMYVKCGVLAKAQQVLDELPARDVATWTALIAGYAEHGLGDEALRCFRQMRDEGLSPDAVTFICILKACGSIGAVEKGEQIHTQVCRKGLLEEDIVLGNALVDMYAKCGALAKAQGVFDKLPARNVATWTTLIAGYAEHGLGDEALSCFEQMRDQGLSPNAVTFICALKACGIIGAIEKGEEIHVEIGRQGLLGNDIVLGTAVVDMYAKCGVLAKAQGVFDKLLARNVVTWNALIAGYSQHGPGDVALSCFVQMRDEGLSPNAVTYICILKACGSIGAVEKGEEIHAEVGRQGLLEKDIVVGNAMVDMYAKCGALAKAQGVFDKLPAQNVVTWNALITGYAQHGLGDEALSCYRRMRDRGLSPDTVTLFGILKACGSIGVADECEEIHTEISKLGLLKEDNLLCTALVHMYAKCGELGKAEEAFNKLPARGVATWTALLAGYALGGKVKNVFESFTKMIGEGIEPNIVTFIVLLTACSHAGLVEEGQMYFCTMNTVFRIIPTLQHHTCMVDIFSRAGHLDMAISVIQKVPPSDSLVLWSTLMGACQTWVNVELGKWAFEHAVQLDENFAAGYVRMSNLYAAAGLCEEADQVKGLKMEEMEHGRY